MSYSSKGRKVRRRRKNLNIRNLIILVAGVIIAVVLFILLISGGTRIVTKTAGLFSVGNKGESSSEPSETVSDASQPESEPENTLYTWSTIQVTAADESQGSLILVDASHEYTSEPEDLLIFYGNKTTSYSLRVAEIYAKSSVVSATNSMMDAFSAATGNRSAMLTNAYRTVSAQQSIADSASSDSTTADQKAAGGQSEHQTGYAIDFISYSQSSGSSELDGTGDFAWLNENCYKYGFILRYTDDKSSYTGYSADYSHFRYVGKVHAEAITRNGYCLEEYIDMLKLHDSEDPYSFTSEDGTVYYIYYTPSEGDTIDIPVIDGKTYQVSGTNDGGFVTIVPISTSASVTTSDTSSDSTVSDTGTASGLTGTSGEGDSSDVSSDSASASASESESSN